MVFRSCLERSPEQACVRCLVGRKEKRKELLKILADLLLQHIETKFRRHYTSLRMFRNAARLTSRIAASQQKRMNSSNATQQKSGVALAGIKELANFYDI